MTFKLLVVDDEAIMRKGIANFIDWDSLDCKVAGTAGNGMEAIEFIKASPVDIVITDIKMPVASRTRRSRSSPPGNRPPSPKKNWHF